MATKDTSFQVTKWQLDRPGCCQLAAVGLWVLINLPAFVVLCRSSGPLQPLSSAGAAGLALLLTTLGLAAGGLWCSVEEPCEEFREIVWRKVWQGLLNTFPLAVVWDTSVPPGAPFTAAITISLGVVLLSATLLGRWWEFAPPIPLPATLAPAVAALPAGVVPQSPISQVWDPELSDDPELQDESHSPAFPKGTHWQTRCTDAGHEVIEGVAIARLPAGQKQLQLHIAFCPPLSGPPQVEHDFPDDTPVRSKVAATYSYGIRMEIRRGSDARDELVFPVHYTAWADAAAADSAA